MARINVYRYPTEQELYNGVGETTLSGWFNPDSATAYREAENWDGSNNISVNTDSQWDHQTLYRTKQGRWVLNSWSQRSATPERYEFIAEGAAKSWLLHNQHDAAVQQWFGRLDEEAGPNLGGRPTVGPTINVAYPRDLIDKIENAAKAAGLSRAAWLRRIAEDATS